MPKTIKVPAWLPALAAQLTQEAETLFPGEKRGEEKKAWVVARLQEHAARRNNPLIPDSVEDQLEPVLIGAFVDVAWGVISAFVQSRRGPF